MDSNPSTLTMTVLEQRALALLAEIDAAAGDITEEAGLQIAREAVAEARKAMRRSRQKRGNPYRK